MLSTLSRAKLEYLKSKKQPIDVLTNGSSGYPR